MLVQKYLQIPATSAPSKRFFSLSALVLNKQRNRLTKDTFEWIMSLKSWGFIEEHKEEEEEDKEGEAIINNKRANKFVIK